MAALNVNAILYNGAKDVELKDVRLKGNNSSTTPTYKSNNDTIATTKYVTIVEDNLKHDIDNIKKYLDNLNPYVFKGSCTYEELPERGEAIGDVWNVTNWHDNIPAGTNYCWTGNEWDALGGAVNIDLTDYATKNYVDDLIASINNKDDSDFENLPIIDSITGQEKVIVDKDDEKYITTINRIRNYIQEFEYGYLEIDINSFWRVNGNFETGKTWMDSSIYKCILIDRKTINSNKIRLVADSWKISFAFLTDTPSVNNNNYCLGTSVITLTAPADAIRRIPDDCTLIYIYVGNDTVSEGIHIYEVVDPQYDEKLDKLNERVSRLEQSAIAPVSFDSVSRDEFEALKDELYKLKYGVY